MKLQVTRVEQRTSENREIKPPVKCFCCWDSGRAANQFLSEFVDIPESGDFLPFICKRYDCEAGEKLITAYEKSDQEREAAWSKLAEKDPNIPKFIRSRDFQANWSTALPANACESMHRWGLDEWVKCFVKKERSPQYQTVDTTSTIVIDAFNESVADRDRTYQEIEAEIAKLQIDITPNLEKFLNHCRDRDGKEYLNIKSLPTADYKVLLTKIKGISS